MVPVRIRKLRHVHFALLVLVGGIPGLVACQHSAPRTDAAPAAETASFLDRLPPKALEERAFMSQPESWFVARLDAAPVVVEGQHLHPKLQYEFQERAKARAASNRDYNAWLVETWSTEAGRQAMRDAVDVNWVKMAYDAGPLASVDDRMIPGAAADIRVRVYQPQRADAGPVPALLYFHGGGYLFASIEAVEPQARILAKTAGIVVVSVDYSLAPEHPFPAAQEDAIAAYEWLTAHAAELGVDPDRIGVGGDSAGGNLAVVVSSELAQRSPHPPKAQLLYYPFLDVDFASYGSFDVFGDGYGLDKNFIRIATDSFVTDAAAMAHRWLNLTGSIALGEQPPTIVATAGFDPIRDQGAVFAERLADAGVTVVHRNYGSLNHGFLEASAVIDDAHDACFETARLIGEFLRQ